MMSTDAIPSLNRLLHLMLRSFPVYSVDVRPVTFRGPEEMRDLLRQVADEQLALAERIIEAIRSQNATPDPGQFPIAFTAWNDVALPRVLQHAAELLQKVVVEADEIAAQHPQPPVFHFAREVRSLANRHCKMLEAAPGTKAETAS